MVQTSYTKSDWMKNNPKLARPSIGRGLPVVHTPS